MKHEKIPYPFFPGSKYVEKAGGWIPLDELYGSGADTATKEKSPRRRRLGRERPENSRGAVRVAVLGRMTDGTIVIPLVMSGWAADCLKFPGGQIEPGEILIEAGIRETAEETGVLLTEEELIPLGEKMLDVKGYPMAFFVATIDASRFEGSLKKEGDEGEIVALTPYERLGDEDFLHGPMSRENPPLFFDHRKLAVLLKEYIEDKGREADETILLLECLHHEAREVV